MFFLGPRVIQCKLYFLLASHKKVQTGKEWLAIARVLWDEKTIFVNARGVAFHYIPEFKRYQFNTTEPLSPMEVMGAQRDDRAITVHKKMGHSCAPAGTYVIFRLNRRDPGKRNLRFEVLWEWGPNIVGRASYNFVFLEAYEKYDMKPYTPFQTNLLDDLWPEWRKHVDCCKPDKPDEDLIQGSG
ncbi:hypothetical protein F4808DRAFT_408880 [Astrocystis sublimbata]|nr:hypothetical protein F4808DRAFT_408880 [Astrocystis sublimbata]